MGNTINRPPPAAVAAPTTAAADTAPAGDFDVADYIKNGPEAQGARAAFGENSSYTKAFDKGVAAGVAKLGPNPSEADVKKVLNKEYFAQHIFKFAADRASSKTMDRIKELSADMFG
jgi:hypothetical protein